MVVNSSKTINLALQGGGSHGAFTWGVLNRLLDEERLQYEAISGVSSGAMNAVLFADGYMKGGSEGAKQSLSDFWKAVASEYNDLFESSPVSIWNKAVGLDYPGTLDSYLSLTEKFSPYELNPFNLNPLKNIVQEHVDFNGLKKFAGIALHIGATEVRTGKMRVFTNKELSADVLLASACLPSLHHAIEINGEAYWDGAFSGNPPLYPLIFNSKRSDILVVLLQPLSRNSLPKSVEEIRKRTNELSFNNTFLREMRAIALSKDKIKESWLGTGSLEKKISRLNIHVIEDRKFRNMDSNSRYNAGSDFIHELYSQGNKHTSRWLKKNLSEIGKRSTIDLVKTFV